MVNNPSASILDPQLHTPGIRIAGQRPYSTFVIVVAKESSYGVNI